MQKQIDLPHPIAQVFDLWRHVQVAFPNVTRFSQYHERLRTRRQDNLAHCYSLSMTTGVYLTMLRPHVHLDEPLVQLAVQLHELGEGLLGRDVLYANKTHEKDLDEYHAVVGYLDTHIADAQVRDELTRAFLLQFALACPEVFPEEAYQMMQLLRGNKGKEAVLFDVLERIDYITYGIEAYVTQDLTEPLCDILHNQLPHLRRHAQQFFWVRQVLWPDEQHAWAEAFMRKHAPAC